MSQGLSWCQHEDKEYITSRSIVWTRKRVKLTITRTITLTLNPCRILGSDIFSFGPHLWRDSVLIQSDREMSDDWLFHIGSCCCIHSRGVSNCHRYDLNGPSSIELWKSLTSLVTSYNLHNDFICFCPCWFSFLSFSFYFTLNALDLSHITVQIWILMIMTV